MLKMALAARKSYFFWWFIVQTHAEWVAAATVTDFCYEPDDIRRYSAAVDGTTDDTQAVVIAIKQAQ